MAPPFLLIESLLCEFDNIQDHMRRAGDVCFSEVFRDRGGMPY